MKIYKRENRFHLDVTIDNERYRESLGTTDHREAKGKAHDRIAEIKAGKVKAASGRAFARLRFREAAVIYQQERQDKVALRTMQFESERLKPLNTFFGDRIVRTIKATHISEYQRFRLSTGISGRTVNMETGVLRRILKSAKLFAVLSEFPKPFPEHERELGRALPSEAKRLLFQVAASRPAWMVAHCAAVLAASTTCRSVELKSLRWRDVDLRPEARTITIRRSKTAGGHRTIPLNQDAVAALARLWERAEADDCTSAEHYVFPSCEHVRLDGAKPQKSWRTAWRSLVKETGRQAGRQAAAEALRAGGHISHARREDCLERSGWSLCGFPLP